MKNFVAVAAIMLMLVIVSAGSTLHAQVVFSAPVTYPAGDWPTGIFPADYDGDGHCDLAVTHIWSRNLYIYLNNGDGSLNAPSIYGTDIFPWSLFSADFDGDSDFDIVVVRGEAYSSSVSVFLNLGDGTFAPRVNYSAGDFPREAYSADFDGDGHNDLAVTNEYSDDVSVLIGNGDGTFLPAVHYDVGYTPVGIFAADFDNNGAIDLAVASSNSHYASVLYNNGDGTFQPTVNYPAGSYPRSITAADFDDDGWPDFAVTCDNSWAGGIWIFFNDGTGAFQAPVIYNPTQWFSGIVADDFNNDGAIDFATRGSGYLYFYVNNGDGSFASPALITAGAAGNPHAADFDGDGRQDVAVVDGNGDAVAILFNLTPTPSCCRLPGDVNHDEVVDVLDFQYLRDYLHKDGPEPPCLEEADVDGDGEITKEDMSCMARYLFSTGNPCVFEECP